MATLFFSQLFNRKSSTFRTAILTNNTNKICRFLDIKRDYLFKELDNSGNTALLLAIKYSSPLTVRLLLDQGANPDQTNFLTFQTPLSLLTSTIYENHQSQQAKLSLEMASILLDHNADVDKPSPYMLTDENGKDFLIKETPLMTAVRTRNLPMANLFIERNANVNYFEQQSENRPIHFSIANGDVTMFDLLENAGALCQFILTKGRNNLLHCFCSNRANDQHMLLLKRIIDQGCNIDGENITRHTPLMLAARLDMINTCHVLLNAHANINQIDNKGYRAIDLTKPNSQCFELLQQASHRHHVHNGNLHKKQILSTYSQSQSTNHLDSNEIKSGQYVSKTISMGKLNENNLLSMKSNRELDYQEMDTKYQHMWEKLLHKKQKGQRPREYSIVFRL